MTHKHTLMKQRGFSLIEMAIVLFIVALLLGGLLPTVSSQIELQHRRDTRKQLDEIQQALMGFAIINGRLPCPANGTIPTLPGVANGAGLEVTIPGPPVSCSPAVGVQVLPWATLGVSEADAWGRRFTYSVSPSFATSTPPTFSLSSAGTLTVKTSTTGSTLASNIPAVIISHGINGAGAYTSNGTQNAISTDLDEIENSDNNTFFISRDASSTFNDLVIWISPNILFNRMVTAGKLP